MLRHYCSNGFENEFCASKFIGMFESDEKFYGEKIWDVHRSINIETKYAIPQIDNIIERLVTKYITSLLGELICLLPILTKESNKAMKK